MFLQMMAGSFLLMLLSTLLCYRLLEEEEAQLAAKNQAKTASLCTNQSAALRDSLKDSHD